MYVSADSLSCLALVRLLERNIQTADVTSKFPSEKRKKKKNTYEAYQKCFPEVSSYIDK